MQRGQSHCHASSRRHSSQAIRLEKAGAAPGKDGSPMLGQKSAKLPCFGHSRYSAGKNCLLETIVVANSRRSSSRMPPSRPRASPRSRASACDPHDVQRRASTSTARCSVHLHDAADDGSIGEHIVIVIVPLAGGAARGGALEDQIVLVHFTELTCAASFDHLVSAHEQCLRDCEAEGFRGL